MPDGSHAHGLVAPYDELLRELATFIPKARLVTEPLRLLAYGTDASFYRLVPKIVVVVDSEEEVVRLLHACAHCRTPVTFRAAGTSLSGQAISDSVLVMLGDGWRGCTIAADASLVTLQPGVIGAEANRRLAPHGRKLGPDPASIDAAMIGGIAANNASGMCCGTAQNTYHTLDGMRVVLADGTVLDTRDAQSRAAFVREKAGLVQALDELARTARGDAALSARIRHKFRMKNTTGYSLNALVDFDDPLDVLAHLMVGSEGTLGFMSSITYRTVADHRDKASALILFGSLETACKAVTLLADTPVAAVELADRAALRSVEDKPGMPPALRAVGPDGAALLVETRAADGASLARQIEAIEASLRDVPTFEPVRFSTDAAECARYWNVRKGMFPSVGAVRKTGTTVIIEDVAFPVERLAAATLDLQALLRAHGYSEAIIFGHALAGNLHFVFTQDFNDQAEIDRYARFMDELCQMVVGRYDGALKAEHGTGRNIAPFVELEWGAEAYALMREVKRILDPTNLLNPGVVINDDPRAHLANLKPLPQADPLVDRCIECGFCEPKCPSRGLTFSPRQRIAGWREVARLERAGADADAAQTRAAYVYPGLETCAACGLCATACPVGIETGLLVKALRGRAASPLAHRVAEAAAGHFGAVTKGVRVGLAAANAFSVLRKPVERVRRMGVPLPKWSATLPRPAQWRREPGAGRERIVYFPSCASRNMGAQPGDDAEALPTIAQRLFAKANFDAVMPDGLSDLCCGQPFESKGFAVAADRKSGELESALRAASEDGRLPIVFDTSPCAYRMKRYLAGRLEILDSIEFIGDTVLPRVSVVPRTGPITVHPVCSVRKMNLVEKLDTVARACCAELVTVPDVLCCGFAGDRGFTHPELNEHALRRLAPSLPDGCRHGYSTSRTCEIGLSEQAGFPYRSLLDLVDSCTHAKAT
jgi:D-lactate dehydrogenase